MTPLLSSGWRRVIQSYYHTRNNTLARKFNVIDIVRVNKVFLIQIMFILTAMKSHFQGSYDKQNLIVV